MAAKTTLRNREIVRAFAAGQSREELAKQYGLSLRTVRQVIAIEKNKEAVSPDPYYEDLRLSGGELERTQAA